MALATKTINAINAAIEADQGASFRALERVEFERACKDNGDAFNPRSGSRSHLGASLIGRQCARALWYSFRWYAPSHFDGRMMRLFNRGHLEEMRFIALLKMIGCEVWCEGEDHKQLRITYGVGHFGGSLDAVIRGCPDLLPGEVALSEFKTHSDASFTKLEKQGVADAKFEHWVQMQVYMHFFSLKYALYLAANKNNDALYGEIVHYSKEQAERYVARGLSIVGSSEPPSKISNTPGWWQCKSCDFRQVCHFKEKPEVTCRSCEHSQPGDVAGQWICRQCPALLTVLDPDMQKSKAKTCGAYTRLV